MSDHKDGAELSLHNANTADWNGNWAALNLAQAQVEATLYLAEQQRIANLISALSDAKGLMDEGWLSYASPAVIERIQQRNVLRAQIREGLGLA